MNFVEEALAHGLKQHQAGRTSEARSVYELLLSQSHDPRIQGAALGQLARLNIADHRLHEARVAAKRALHLDRDNGTALLAAAQVERRAGRPQQAIEILSTRSTHELPPTLIHELGQCWQAMGQYRKAFLCFKEAKRRISFTNLDVDRSLLTRYLERLANRYGGESEPDWSPTPDSTRPDPVFIIGFNESGVPELGRMLSTHPDVGLAKEVPALDAARRVFGPLDPVGLHQADEPQILAARRAYFEVMDARVHPGKIIVDALPMNALALALIRRMFPEALVLRCIRHPCEATLSTFIKPYAFNSVTCHFDRLERTATTLLATVSVSLQIERALSMEVHHLPFEAFAAQPQETVNAIVTGLGLQPVKTASLTPASPVDLWPSYRAEMSRWLEPLCALAEELGYPAK